MTVSPGYAPNTVTADGSTRYWPITFEYADVDEIKIRSDRSASRVAARRANAPQREAIKAAKLAEKVAAEAK